MGAAAPRARVTMLPEQFGRYEIQGLLGEGSMGRVFRAFDPLGQRAVAVKAVRPEHLTRETREDYLRRFRREAQAAGSLSHPSIVTIYDVGDDFFVMELVEGVTLLGVLKERRALPLEDTLRILAPVADALDYAHAKGVIHRDIKPGNIMLLPDGRPKLMDFGVAHLASTVMTAAGQFLGSPSYMAPEQISKSEASPATDVFSLAVVAYEMLTGRKPFEGDSITGIIYRVVNEEAPPPSRHDPALPPEFDAIFKRALAKEPARRYATCRAFLSALEGRVVEPEPAPAPQAQIPVGATAHAGPYLAETQDLRESPTTPGGLASRRIGLALAAALALVLAAVLRRPEPPAAPPTSLAVSTTATLEIETSPAGAAVSIDGREAGRSPLTLPRLAAGTHTVRVVREGFAPAELGLELQPGSVVPLRFSLQGRVASPPPAGAVPPRPRPTPVEPAPGMAPLQRIHGEAASYPATARKLRLQGAVEVEMTVNERGIPEDIRVVQSAGAVLDEAVIEAVQGFRYKPATLGGKKVPIRHKYRHVFKIED